VITNPAHFVSSHLEFVRHNNGNVTFRPYFFRLLDFKKHLESQSECKHAHCNSVV
jgi:hypothetical protein